ncbi:MAG: ATP-binding response regulator [Desulfomonilaceae bacterium]
MVSGLDNPKILIAEDSKILNDTLRDVFEEHGFEVFQAFDGSEGKNLILKESPDIALIDVHMPRISGFETLRYAKEKAPRIIVIVMSSAENPQVGVKAMKLGADDYLTKPFSTEDVVELALKLLENRRCGDENVRLKKEIRSSEKYLAHLTTIINEALITTDLRGNIQSINRAASNLWGYTFEELKDKDIHFLVRGEARTLLYRDIVKDSLQHGKVEGEFHFRKKDNSTFPGYLSTSIIKESNRPRGIVIVVAELTRVYAVEQRLKQSEKLASLGRVVEGVAHEVRNCLTSLGGFALRLHKMSKDNLTASNYTQIILNDVGRLEKMVKDIEEYVRFSKFYKFNFEKTDLVPLIERAREKALHEISEDLARKVNFSLHPDKNLPKAQVDPAAIEEVFFNLIRNAYESMPNGGRLKVTVANQRPGLSVAFIDTGIGIHSQDISEIFTPFFTSKTAGAGMGLSKVHMLLEEHRGAIKVSSEPGKGSTFEVFLPVERLTAGVHPWEATSPVRFFRGYKRK